MAIISNGKKNEGEEVREIQEIIDIVSVILLWAVGIVCIPIMKKIAPLQWKAYAIYDMAICVIITIFAILYLCQR